MARRRSIWAAVWTPAQYQITKTQAGARDLMRFWKKLHEEAGWNVRSCGPEAYIATSPEGVREAIVLHEYDPVTKRRIIKLPEPQPVVMQDQKPETVRRPARRGRPAHA